MTNSLVKRAQQSLVERKQDNDLPLWNPFAASTPFFSFTHSYSEVTSDGSQTQLKSTTTSLTDGKLSKESFERTLPGEAFGDAVAKAQMLFLKQAEMLMQPWWSLPSASVFMGPNAEPTKRGR